MDDATKKQLVARITLCAEILAEQKSMLTLEQEEYALLTGEPYSPFNSAMVVAADEDFRGQIRWIERVLTGAMGQLSFHAINMSYPDAPTPEDLALVDEMQSEA